MAMLQGIIAIAVLAIAPATARADFVEVRHSANLYAESNSDSAVLAHFDPDTVDDPIRLSVVASERPNGYYNVSASDGRIGFIYRTRVRHFAGDIPGGLSTPSPFGSNVPVPSPTAGGPAAANSSGAAANIPGGLPVDAGTGDRVIRLTNAAFAVGYSESRWDPLWVAHRVGKDRPHSCERLKRFKTDSRTESGVTHDDYNSSGYDRGHMAPSATIGSEFGCPAQDETYLLSNIAPQTPSLNQRAWGGFENVVQDSYATRFNGVWIITGPIFDPAFVRELCSGVEVPIAFFKIVVRDNAGQLDALTVVMKQDTAPGTKISALVRSIDGVEQETGINFFAALPDDVENALESRVATANDWQLSTTLDTTFPGAARDKCEKPPVPRATPIDG